MEGYDGLEYRSTDEGFAKEAAAADDGQDGFVTPAVFVDPVYFPAQDNADVANFVLGQDQEFSFTDGPDPRAQTGEAVRLSGLMSVNKWRTSGRADKESVIYNPS